MDPFTNIPTEDIALNFSAFTWAMIVLGAVTMRLLPLLMAVGAVLKLRAFPEMRPLHVLLLIELALLGALALVETFALVPGNWRVTGAWSFLWIFVIAWTLVTWVRSAMKTRLRPRWIEITTLVCAALLIFSLSAAILPDMLSR
ncbi:hypothetical protein HKCCE4037_19050 [Rhodobacterales bacterium HKCCE4037]|nr:hypothetical protein [Rhodobacterales bacterium HKCCE4037]